MRMIYHSSFGIDCIAKELLTEFDECISILVIMGLKNRTVDFQARPAIKPVDFLSASFASRLTVA